MGSVGFDGGEDESLPSTSNGKKNKIPRKLLNDCVAVNPASVPRKLRSAMKKRGRESITPPLPISRKQHHMSNGTDKTRKDGAKKSKLNMKQGRVTKDEKEVAETLYALADMFSDAAKSNQPGLDDEPPQTKSSTILEDTGNVTSQKHYSKTSSKVVLEAPSNLLDSTAQVVESQSSGDTQQPKVHSSTQPSTAIASGLKPYLSPDPRPKLSTADMVSSSERAVALEPVVTDSEIRHERHYDPMQDKNNGSFLSPSSAATGTRSSETTGPCQRLPTRLENTKIASQPRVTENSIGGDKYPQAAVESKKSWKRCAAQVYIGRLIKVLQISEKKEGLLEKPTQLAICGGAEPRPHTSTHNQTRGINGRNGAVSFNGIRHFDTEKSSAGIQNDGENYNFLSLDAGDRGLDVGEAMNRAGHSHEAPRDSHVSYMQLQNQSAMPFSLSKNGYSSTFYGHASGLAAAQQVQFPQYSSSTINSYTARMGQQMEPQQQKWSANFPSQYNSGGVAAKPYQSDWRNGETESLSMLYTQALFPHLHSAISSKYQPFSLP
ncbi:hypothetical protein BUALT_Bualt08G0083500 [Buddleja alternifolia]|uniref:Uncharacterized protein n=1 Tax=Buddleja alternifolia TaxID=168488 RepID=A0AAV6XFQ2_9LAMI|nr:hypothetical protein BUALT_Bualt08G0083500 [Buddleja alternifolia]